MTVPEACQRLQNIADDCEERARLATGDARALFHRTARDARLSARSHLGEDGMRKAIDAALSNAAFAACMAGDVYESAPEPARAPPECFTPLERPDSPPKPLGDLLNARKLADLCGKSQRTALRDIMRGVFEGKPGFHLKGCHWFAERDAFEQLRGQVSELCPNGTAGLNRHHDEGYHRQAAGKDRPQSYQAACRRGD